MRPSSMAGATTQPLQEEQHFRQLRLPIVIKKSPKSQLVRNVQMKQPQKQQQELPIATGVTRSRHARMRKPKQLQFDLS